MKKPAPEPKSATWDVTKPPPPKEPRAPVGPPRRPKAEK